MKSRTFYDHKLFLDLRQEDLQTHSGAEDRDGIAMEACRRGNIAHLLHGDAIDKVIVPLAAALQVAEVLEHAHRQYAGQSDCGGGAQHHDRRLSGHDLSTVPHHHTHRCVHQLARSGATASANTPQVDGVGGCNGDRPGDGGVEARRHPLGQLQDSPLPQR